jgi:hypothetical protein
MRVFPDACIVQLHRDPQKVIPSLCSLFAVYQGMTSDCVAAKRLGPDIAELCDEGLRRGHAAREAHQPGRVLDIRYHDLVRDPLGTLRQIYDHFGYTYTEELERRARKWVEENPKNKHGKHQYDLAQFGLDEATIDRMFRSYCLRYDIQPEARPAAGVRA